jgi:hypothetical protein
MRLLALALFFVLFGCAGAVPWSKQDYAGITRVEIAGSDCLPDTHYTSGKEAEGLKASVSCEDGKVVATIEASGVRAFDGQAFRAEVEKLSAEMQANIAPSVVDAIVSAALKAAGL